MLRTILNAVTVLVGLASSTGSGFSVVEVLTAAEESCLCSSPGATMPSPVPGCARGTPEQASVHLPAPCFTTTPPRCRRPHATWILAAWIYVSPSRTIPVVHVGIPLWRQATLSVETPQDPIRASSGEFVSVGFRPRPSTTPTSGKRGLLNGLQGRVRLCALPAPDWVSASRSWVLPAPSTGVHECVH